MLIKIVDYNKADVIIKNNFSEEWSELEPILLNMPLYVKESQQKGKDNQLTFDPIGTNKHLGDELTKKNWCQNISIPKKFSALGTDIDFGKNHIVLESQFSNYPFLSNNILRSEIMFRAHQNIDKIGEIKLLIILTKDHAIPSANSSLYCQQARNQVKYSELIFKLPIRLISLNCKKNEKIKAVKNNYKGRYSRDLINDEKINCELIIKENRKTGQIKIH